MTKDRQSPQESPVCLTSKTHDCICIQMTTATQTTAIWMEIKSILPSHLLLIHAESLLFFLNLHSVADIIQLIIPILECRTKGFTSFPPIFCFNPSPSRGSPVLAQKWHGFAVSSKKKSFVYYLFFKVSRLPVIISIFSSALNIYIYTHTPWGKFSVEHPFKKQIQLFQ